ncbi:MAG: apolipoprotein N-acyltransferase [Thiotrichales bacterium]|nr:apolipoprotein N-acyltransferase [Thiotrichales bacterium]
MVFKPVAGMFAGILAVSGFSPFDLFFNPFLSLAVLFYLYISADSARQSFVYGYCFGFGLFAAGVSWLHISINLFGGVNFLAAAGFTLLLILFLALYPAVTGWLVYRYRECQTWIQLIIIFPAAWTLFEWLRSWIFTGFPWLNMGYSQTDTPLSGMAPILGIYGVSWLTAMTAGILCLLFVGRKREKILAPIALVCIWTFSIQSQQTGWTQANGRTLSVALVQGGVPQEIKWLPEQRRKTIDLYLDLTEPYWGQDLILWPETALPMFYHEATHVIEQIRTYSREHNTALISGMAWQDNESRDYFNSLVLFGETDSMYHKQHLVPFGEYLPWDNLLRPFLNFLEIPMSNFSPGNQEKPVLVAAGEVLGVSICYEDAFGEEVIRALPEAGLLLNVSNDAWFGDSIAPHQHLQMARMRSIETGRYMIRATNTGISAVIDQKGNLIKQSPQFKSHVISAHVLSFEGATPYIKTGNFFVIGLMLAMLGLCIPRKKQQAEDHS